MSYQDAKDDHGGVDQILGVPVPVVDVRRLAHDRVVGHLDAAHLMGFPAN